jgi:hypothetical protein
MGYVAAQIWAFPTVPQTSVFGTLNGKLHNTSRIPTYYVKLFSKNWSANLENG